MSSSTTRQAPATDVGLDPAPTNVRVRIAAAWVSMMFVFAYVDLFSLYRPDIREGLAGGELAGFTVGEGFLLGVTAYVLPACLMILVTLVVGARVARWLNVVLAIAYGLTIIGAGIGEMGYYLLGSAVELFLLVAIVRLAWAWPRPASSGT